MQQRLAPPSAEDLSMLVLSRSPVRPLRTFSDSGALFASEMQKSHRNTLPAVQGRFPETDSAKQAQVLAIQQFIVDLGRDKLECRGLAVVKFGWFRGLSRKRQAAGANRIFDPPRQP